MAEPTKADLEADLEKANKRIKELEAELEARPEASDDEAPEDLDGLLAQIDELGDDGVPWSQAKNALRAAVEQIVFVRRQDTIRLQAEADASPDVDDEA